MDCSRRNKNTAFNSPIWHRLASNIFGKNTHKNRQWLFVIWTYNGRNIRGLTEETLLSKTQQNQTVGERGEFVESHFKCQYHHTTTITEVQNLPEKRQTQNQKQVIKHTDMCHKYQRNLQCTFLQVWKQIQPLKYSNKLRKPRTH